MNSCWCGGKVIRLDAAPTVDRCAASTFHDPNDVAPTEPARFIYISGPMSGYPECNYPEFFRVEKLLQQQGLLTVNPANNDTGKSYREIIRGDLLMLINNCDGLALLDGWEHSRGAKVERHIAEVMQMDIRPYREWLNAGTETAPAEPTAADAR